METFSMSPLNTYIKSVTQKAKKVSGKFSEDLKNMLINFVKFPIICLEKSQYKSNLHPKCVVCVNLVLGNYLGPLNIEKNLTSE